MILTIEHVSVRNNENQASQVFVLTYLDGFAVCLWKLVSPTWSAKILATEIFTKLWRTQGRRYNAGGQNLWTCAGFAVCPGNFVVARLSSEPSSSKGVCANFGTEIFAKHGRHAAFEAQRGGPKIVGHFRDSRCVSGTFFVQLGPRKFWVRKFPRSMGSTQRLRYHAGSQKPTGMSCWYLVTMVVVSPKPTLLTIVTITCMDTLVA